MKSKRRMMILDIISNNCITTQEELAQELMKRGEKVTQATISRDIKELRLVKASDENGVNHYTIPNSRRSGLTERQIRIFAESVQYITYAHNIVLIKTISGGANAAAETLDRLNWPEILGCIAGDNTIMTVLSETADPKAVTERLNNMLG